MSDMMSMDGAGGRASAAEDAMEEALGAGDYAEAAMLALMRTGIFSELGVEDGQVRGFSPYGDLAALLNGEPGGQDSPDREAGEDGLADGDWGELLGSQVFDSGDGSRKSVKIWVDDEGKDMSGPRPCLGTIYIEFSDLKDKDGHYKGADLSGIQGADSGLDLDMSR